MDDAHYLERDVVPASADTDAVADRAPEPPLAIPPRVAALFRQLEEAPHVFGFWAAMRRLEAEFSDRPRLGRSVHPAQDRLRLAQDPSTIFAPSTLAAFERGDAETTPRLLVHFFGLFGPDGPLPLHLTEYARDRRRNARDPTFQRFADMFHHRALSLFYRAWADVRPTVSFDRPHEDRFATYVGALIGLGWTSLRDRDAMPDLTKLHFAGHLSAQTRHASGLAAILSAFFQMPVRVDCFIGSWLTLPERDRTVLGDRPETGALGRAALLGGRVWSRQDKFRIVFGALTIAQYERMLPGGESLRRLIAMVRNYTGDVLAWDVNLVLQERQVPPTVLGRQGRIGWTTWLGTRPHGSDAVELFLDASAESRAQSINAATDRHRGST